MVLQKSKIVLVLTYQRRTWDSLLEGSLDKGSIPFTSTKNRKNRLAHAGLFFESKAIEDSLEALTVAV